MSVHIPVSVYTHEVPVNHVLVYTMFQITIVSFLVGDSIPFTTVELLQIQPADMSVNGAEDKVQVIGKKQGAKGPVSLVTF